METNSNIGKKRGKKETASARTHFRASVHIMWALESNRILHNHIIYLRIYDLEHGTQTGQHMGQVRGGEGERERS